MQSFCVVDPLFTVWPNPITDRIVVNLGSDKKVEAVINLYDTKGALVKHKVVDIAPRNNILQLETSEIPRGAHLLEVAWSVMKKVVKVVKQ